MKTMFKKIADDIKCTLNRGGNPMKDRETIKKAVDTLRVMSAEVISNVGTGHSGIALGAAPLLYAAYASMKIDPSKPEWFNRDRFVMSAGHGSSPLYTTLHLFGYDVKMEDLKQFRQLGSRTPGHPEIGETPGVDCSTGPLGQGVAMAVGLAFAEKKLAEMFNKEGQDIVDHYTFCLAGDGCLMEGVSYEACNLAGLHKLHKLIMLYDKNDITLDGARGAADGECIKARFEACGWNVIEVADANGAEPVMDAIAQAKASTDKPTLIVCQTVIGLGHKTQGTSKAHGAVLTADETTELRKKFGLEGAALTMEKSVAKHFEALVFKKGGHYKTWQAVVDKYKMQHQDTFKKLNQFLSPSKMPIEITAQGKDTNFRNAGHAYLNQIAEQSARIIGVNADVASSTQVFLKNGNDIACGVREFAMAAICNGLALHGFTPFCGTFLAFSDYCRSAIRSTALMNLPVTYIFTHDGLGHCPDGPTHQGNEHISSLRIMPNMKVFRPCDDYEIAATYKWVFENNKPATIILGRGDAKLVNGMYNDGYFAKKKDATGNCGAEGDGLVRGGYLVRSHERPAAVLLSAGAEVSLCVGTAELLEKTGLNVNVASIPSFELFDMQPKEYRESVLGGDLPKVVVELGNTDLWYKYAGVNGRFVSFKDFGHSAPNDVHLQKLGFTPEQIAKVVMDAIKNK